MDAMQRSHAILIVLCVVSQYVRHYIDWKQNQTSTFDIRCWVLEIHWNMKSPSRKYLRLSQRLMSLWLRKRIPASPLSSMRRAGASG